MKKSKTMLITGASGFLGTWLAKTAYDQGWILLGLDIVATKRPELFASFVVHPCDRVDFASLFAGFEISVVFHLAGAASVPQSVENPIGDFSSLVPGTVSLLAFLARYRPDVHLVLFSSAAVYGNPARLPIKETDPYVPISPYGIHKAASEFLVEQYSRVYGLRSSVLRIFSAYGEGLYKQVVWDLAQRAIQAIREGHSNLQLQGTGNETRDFIHASDVAQAALLVADIPPSAGNRTLNVASGTETTIRHLAEIICKALDTNLEVKFTGVRRSGDPANWRADVSRLTNLGFVPETDLEKGIFQCVSWQRHNAA